ncbi:unnamed protein product [Amaranthus hypochondriacus]
MVAKRPSKKSRCVEDDVDSSDKSTKKIKIKLLDEIQEPTVHQQQLESDYNQNDEEEGEEYGEPIPIGDVIRVSGDVIHKKMHFEAFEFDGIRYQLEDTILVAPEEGKVKPSVSIIKDIFQTKDGSLMVSAHRFYRPDEAKKKGSGTWEARDERELFYSCHLDEFSANNVMHKCVIHVVPLYKPLPDRRKDPGFIVQKRYDYVQKKVRNLTDNDAKYILPQSAAAQKESTHCT